MVLARNAWMRVLSLSSAASLAFSSTDTLPSRRSHYIDARCRRQHALLRAVMGVVLDEVARPDTAMRCPQADILDSLTGCNLVGVRPVSWQRILAAGVPPSVTEASQLRTERLENRRAINACVGFQSLPLPRLILRKVRRFGSRKTTQYQSLTSSILRP
jgi:hypothetical protein